MPRGARVWLLAATAVAALAAFGSPVASAASGGATGSTGASGDTGATGTTGATAATNPVLSSNWAGYAVSAATGHKRKFRRVSAGWVQPTATCTPGSSTYSAFWVGLGGMSKTSGKLEQTGTEADCDANGVAHYFAWYELVPAAPVTIRLAVSPGDSIGASVAVRGAYVTMRVTDATTGRSVTRRLHFAHSDLSSAEWIAEAPSNCAHVCSALPLTDFGTVGFTGATAQTANGDVGSISSPYWSAHPIALNERDTAIGTGRFFGPPQLDTALPSLLDATGSSFSVSWAQEQPSAASGPGRFFPGAPA